jgi:hypothetical protein
MQSDVREPLDLSTEQRIVDSDAYPGDPHRASTLAFPPLWGVERGE